MSEFQEKMKRQMTGMVVAGDENRPKRRPEGGTNSARTQASRPASAIMASIMGDHQNHRAQSTGARSEGGATSASGRQHKLKQRFTVIRKLGKGTYGKVQLAVNKETGQEVAIKTIKKTKIENEQDLERVRREIQIMSSIEHPHIVHIYEVFENKDKIVLIMQYAPGGELYEHVSQSKVLDEQEARRLFRQIATAVFYCHQNKICHRDLKLENILLDEKNNAKLADFGLSNVFDKSRQLRTFCGSPLYASPEIVQGSPYEGPEVDCWSLGVLLYTLVYGAMPFDGSNFKRLVKQISEASYYEPKQRSLASPLIGRLLCADPLRRATVLDICSDPWVNGQHLAPATGSPRAPSPTGASAAASTQHPSLLKVAQDMANLTPVRLDILLALTPRSDAPHSNEPAQNAHPQAKLAATDQRQIIQPAREHSAQPQQQSDKMELEKQALQQEQEKAALMDQLGTELMEADETRSSSPVASYVVRDLSPPPAADSAREPDETPKENAEVSQPLEQVAAGSVVDKNEKPSRSIEDEIEQLVAVGVAAAETHAETHAEQPSAGPNDVAMVLDEEEQQQQKQQQQKDGMAQSQDGAEVKSEQIIASEPASLEPTAQQTEPKLEPEHEPESLPQPDIELTNDDKKTLEENHEPAAMHIEEPRAPNGLAQQVGTNLPGKVTNDQENTQDEQQSEDTQLQVQQPPQEAIELTGEKSAAPAGAGEEKPKKVKKRIVVVKKRRKVVKKADGESGQEEAGVKEGDTKMEEEEAAKLDETSQDTQPKKTVRARVAAVPSTGPGKVRIPDTFDPSAQPSAPTPATPKQTATRRPSALITDVSQKLIQQQQQQSATTSSSSAIEQDQPQLASVRVSEKKSEFERRTSLATTSQPAVVVTPRDHERLDLVSALEPECCDARREQVQLQGSLQEPLGAEPVARLQPIQFDQLKVKVAPSAAAGQGSEPLTPTNQRPPAWNEETTAQRLGECAQRLSSEASAQRKEGERSDSVETIKGDGEMAPQVGQQNNIRSSLQIDLSGAQAAAAGRQEATDGPSTLSQNAGSVIGPAPITRSYKKVTFTKDGTCITETGRIYSTQADDGTMRRVERKSKVTHYPANDDASAGTGPAHEETTTHEEIVYESTGGGTSTAAVHPDEGGFWPPSRAGVHSRAPLERLIMPSSSFYDSAAPGAGPEEEFMYSNGQSGKFGGGGGHPRPPPMERADSASSCSSGSTDVFDDIFDTWTGAISMFNQRRQLADLRAFATGSPLPFGRQHSSLSRRNSGSRRGGTHRPQSSSGANQTAEAAAKATGFFPHTQLGSARQRCESVEPDTGASVFEPTFAATTTRRRHHRHNRPPSADVSGYESDAAADPFDRPSLGRARGLFNSSNLFPRHAERPFLDEEPASLLFEQMELEHERLRRKFAQQREQMWQGSTPALNEIPEFRAQPQQAARFSTRSNSGSQWSTSERPPPAGPVQQQPTTKRTSVVLQLGGGRGSGSGSGSDRGSLRQSTPLDAAPLRRNTANLAEHLPPAAPSSSSGQQLVRRSTSKSSFITSQLANIRLGGEPSDPQRSASFLGLKRDSSSSSAAAARTQALAQEGATGIIPQQQQRQQQPGSAVSSATATFWTDGRATPTANSSQEGGPPGGMREQSHAGLQDVEANSRIQSWLLQSAGNLSVSSGSKSSTSDATLPSSGRSDTAAYLASSAGQMAPLRRDESIRTTTTSSLSINPTALGQHQQRTCSTQQSRTVMSQHSASHHLPPAPSRSPSGRPPVYQQQQQMAPSGARPVTSTLIVRSSSRQSLSEQPDGSGQRVECHKVTQARQELMESIVSDAAGLKHHEEARRGKIATTSNSSTSAVISQKMFAFPGGEGALENTAQRLVETRQETVTSTRQEVFSQRAMSPPITTMSGGPQEAWFSGSQAQSKDEDFDSLGDLESVCSSSLLEQLRARGYRSMINQRMTPAEALIQQQQQHRVVSSTSGATTSAHEQTSNVVTTSSTSITMSSSSDAPQVRQLKQADVALPTSVAQPNGFGLAETANSDPTANIPTSLQEPLADRDQTATNNNPSAAAATSEPVVGQNGVPSQQANEHTSASEEPEELDEDVREAKANIKEYLERMRETEKFLKAMHEEEEKSQRQRQELLLFDNLLLSAKLNGIRPGASGMSAHLSSLDTGADSPFGGLRPLRAGPYSAPVTNHLHDSLHSNGFLNNKGGEQPAVAAAPLQMSCFSSDLYRPMAGAGFTTSLMGGGAVPSSSARASDPLEPVQPVSMRAYAPPVRHWNRSKSQLGDQFTDYRSARRPLSANVDTLGSSSSAAASGNVYFPSRQRRSMSQVRYSHHHNNPSVLAHSGMNQYRSEPQADDNDDEAPQGSMLSEYKSSFGPNLSTGVDRQSRSPRRATSPLPSTLGAPRARSHFYHSPSGRNGRTLDDNEDDTSDDLGLSSYRASSYVPRTLPELSSTSSPTRRSYAWRKATADTGDNDGTKTTTTNGVSSLPRHRRSSVQAGGSTSTACDWRRRDQQSETPESSPTRRKSWTTSNEVAGGQSPATNSRLSELEQRIQANKKRREELLSGINGDAELKPATRRRVSGRASPPSDNDGDLDQSFGFERPAARGGAEDSDAPINASADLQESTSSGIGGATSRLSGSAPRARSSRLESMEARIKRRSYCIKLNSPDRTRSRVALATSGAKELKTGANCEE